MLVLKLIRVSKMGHSSLALYQEAKKLGYLNWYEIYQRYVHVTDI